MFRKSNSIDLWLSIAVAAVAIILALVGVNGLPLVPFGLLLVLFLPGYNLLRLLNTFSAGQSPAQIWLFSFGLSLLLTLTGGIVLNILPWGLQAGSWALWLGGLTLIFALLRLTQAGLPAGPGESIFLRLTPLRAKFKPLPAVLLVGATACVVAAFLMARAGAAQPTGNFTQLWLLPAATSTATATTPGAAAANTTTTAVANTGAATGQGQTQAVNLGISNQENTFVRYRLQLVSGNTVLQEWPTLDLVAGQTWKIRVTLPAGAAAAGVEARLYRLDQSDASAVYREVFFAASAQVTPAATRP